MAALDDLEARVAALEASRADYGAVLSAVNALGANQREHALALAGVQRDTTELKRVSSELQRRGTDTNIRVRSLEDNMAEVRDLLIQALRR